MLLLPHLLLCLRLLVKEVKIIKKIAKLMNHKKYSSNLSIYFFAFCRLVFLHFISVIILYSQENYTAQDVVTEINKLRSNPSNYAVLMEAEAAKYKGVKEFKEVVKILKSTEPLDTFVIKYGLEKSAEIHAEDCSKRNIMGHFGSDKSNPQQRMLRYAMVNQVSENIAFGGKTAKETVMMWLIDKGIKNRGHRKTLLNKDLKFIGVAIRPFRKYGNIVVADFCQLYQDYIK